MFQATTTADPSLLAVCGAVIADLWANGSGYTWLLALGYVLGPVLLGCIALWYIDRKSTNSSWLYQRLAPVVSALHLTGAVQAIGRSWLWHRADKALIAVALSAVVAGTSYIGWRVAVARDAGKPVATIATQSTNPGVLTDHRGKPVDKAAFEGKLTLVTFGYTFCPDICPTTLATMSQTLDMLGSRATEMITAFVSIDPQRDTPAVLGPYLEHFHPAITGVTGSGDQIRALAKAYQIYYARIGGDAAGEDYAMEHSAWIFLVGRDGQVLQRFPHTATPEQISERILKAFATPIS